MACTMNDASATIDHASYGTLFDFRRAYTPPDIDLVKPTVPAQPQPVSLGPTSLISSMFQFGQSGMTGAQMDLLCTRSNGFAFSYSLFFCVCEVGGPDRPIPETVQPASASPADASSVAQTAAGVQSSLYARLQSAVGERG